MPRPFKVDLSKKGLESILGSLEHRIMKEIWRQEEGTVRDIHAALKRENELAYTTVMTVMSRLSDKGLLSKSKVGKAYKYKPKYDENELRFMAVKKMLSRVVSDIGKSSQSGFIDKLTKKDREQIERLAALVKNALEEKGD